MDVKEQALFVEQLNHKMNEDPEAGLEFFKTEWVKIDKEGRKILTTLIIVGVGRIVGISELSTAAQLYWLAVANYAEKPVKDGKFIEDIDDEIFPQLTLGEGVNGNQITLIFRDLRDRGYITSIDELIAEAISIIFPIAYSTAYKDLTEDGRVKKVIRLLS
jgi:hypothetical protein